MRHHQAAQPAYITLDPKGTKRLVTKVKRKGLVFLPYILTKIIDFLTDFVKIFHNYFMFFMGL